MSRLTALTFTALPVILGLALSPAFAGTVTTTTVNPQAAAFGECMRGGGSLADCQQDNSRVQSNSQMAPSGSGGSGSGGMLSTDAQPQAIIRPPSADTASGAADGGSTAADSPWSGYSTANGGAVPSASTSDAVANPVVNRNDELPAQPNYPEGTAPYDSPESALNGTATTGATGQAASQGGPGQAATGQAAAGTDPFAAMRGQSSLAGLYPMNQAQAAPRPPVALHTGRSSCADVRRNATGLGVYHIEQANRYNGPAIWVDGRFRRLSVSNQLLYLADLDCGLVARNYGRQVQWTLMEQGSRRVLGQVTSGLISWQ